MVTEIYFIGKVITGFVLNMPQNILVILEVLNWCLRQMAKHVVNIFAYFLQKDKVWHETLSTNLIRVYNFTNDLVMSDSLLYSFAKLSL